MESIRCMESGPYEMEDDDVYTLAIPLEQQKPNATLSLPYDYETPQSIRTSIAKQEDEEDYSTITDRA